MKDQRPNPTPSCRGGFQSAVVVAVLAVRVMQMAAHQIIHVVPMRYLLMAALRAVNVSGLM